MGGSPSGWVIAAAVNSELRGLRSRMGTLVHEKLPRGDVWQGNWEGTPVWLVRTGIGPERVRLTLETILASRRCKAILSIGYAGALHDGHRVGDLLIPEELRALPPLNPGVFYPDAQLFQELCQLARDAGRAFHSHRMVTSDRVIATTREKRALGKIYHAGGVDMESSVVAEIATRATIPFAVIRVVSDSVSFTMPDLSILQYARRKQYLNLARYLLFKPGQTLRIFTLRRYGRRAADSLTAFLAGEALDALIQIPQRPPALTAEA